MVELSVAVVGNIGGGGVSRATLVLTLGSSSIGLSAFEKSSLGSRHILLLSLPGLEHGLLKSATVRESKGPGARRISHLIHGVQIQRSGLFGLASGKESDAGKGGHDSS